MKRVIGILGCMVIMISLCACGGNIKNAKTNEVYSEIYSQQDISNAIDTIKNEFDKEWSGCTLIVLLSSFEVDSSGGDGSLNPNSTYNNWMWILVRTSNEEWKHVDHGY